MRPPTTEPRQTVEKRSIEAIFPLSPAQQGVLFHSVYSDGSRDYHCRTVYRLRGQLKRSAFREAFRFVVARHDGLRAAFMWQEAEQPLQVVLRPEAIELPWREWDWQKDSEAAQRERLSKLLSEDHARGFDLKRAPLLRLHLAQLADDAFYLVLSHHHLVLDGWSMTTLLREVLHAYESLARGQTPSLKPAPRYQSFIRHVRERDPGDAERYWRQQLGRGRVPTPLPADLATTEQPEVDDERETLGLAERVLRLSRLETAQLERLAKDQGVTGSVLMQAAWALVLGRFAGTRDVVIGVTVSGRPAELRDAEQIVGLMINSLPLRVTWQPARAVSTWLRQLHTQNAALRERESDALSDIHRYCDSERAFDALLVVDNFPRPSADDTEQAMLRPVVLGREEQDLVDAWTAQRNHYPLTLVVVPGTSLQLRLAYRRSRFSETRAGLLLASVRSVLSQLARETCIGRITLGTEAALAPVSPAAPAAPTSGLLEPLLERAQRTPTATALVCQGRGLTWRDLESRSRHVARALLARGLEPEARVGLLLGRGIAWIVNMLGVLRAGLCYVPLDPSLPTRRLVLCARDAQLALLVGTDGEPTRSLSVGLPGVPVVAPGQLEHRAPAENGPLPASHPDQLAYVLYTSGTTGEPKGVAVTTGSLTAYVRALELRCQLPPDACWGWLTSVSADLGNTSVFGALATGRRLLIVTDEEAQEGDAVAHRLNEAQVDALKIAPSHLVALIGSAQDRAGLLPRQLLVLGGEALTSGHLHAIRAAGMRDEVAVMNHYGPTECTIGVTTETLTQEVVRGAKPAPLGSALAHASICTLDMEELPVPEGAPGELCVSGSALARGYLRQPALTAARFRPDARPGRAGQRLYHTGDRVMSRGGHLQFLGRVDSQLSVNGYRVEPREVEACLLDLEGVAAAAVELRADAAHARLRAYIVTATGPLQHTEPVDPPTAQASRSAAAANVGTGEDGRTQAPQEPIASASAQPVHDGAQMPGERASSTHAPRLDLEGLRAAAAQLLPPYMVPSEWVELRALPLLPSGKLDRRALPETAAMAGPAFEAPEGPIETTIAEIWGAVLGREAISRRDSFFELGGDSILSLRVVARARRAGLRFSPKQLFDHPTPEGLAACLQRQATSPGAGETAEPAAPSEATSWPLTPVQRWFVEQRVPNRNHFNQSLLLALPTALNPAGLARALEVVVRAHPVLNSAFALEGRQPAQRLCEGGPIPFSVLDASDAAVPAQRSLIEAHCARVQRSHDLARGRVLSVTYIRVGEDSPWAPALLFLCAHHLVIDAVSWQVLLSDLEAAYAGEPVEARETSFGTFCTALRRYASSPALLAQRAFWQAQHSHARLPLDTPCRHNRYRDVKRAHARLGRGETSELEAMLGCTLRATALEVCLSALGRVLGRFYGSPEVAIELESHGRELPDEQRDLSRSVGWFTARYPLALVCDPCSSEWSSLRQIRARYRAVPDAGVGYGVLRYLTPVGARLAALPAPEVTFNFLGRLDRSLQGTWGSRAATELPDAGAERDPEALRPSWLSVNAHIVDGELRFAWAYNALAHHEQTIRRLANEVLDELRTLITRARDRPTEPLLSSDVPLSGLSDEALSGLSV
ncbi:MAG: amino acid adenylation domain-containing protein, partial [Myxococcales bacterium]|nr:amino acid adenylation domain-containing protein [Myxococcales bacterium]